MKITYTSLSLQIVFLVPKTLLQLTFNYFCFSDAPKVLGNRQKNT